MVKMPGIAVHILKPVSMAFKRNSKAVQETSVAPEERRILQMTVQKETLK